MFITGLLEEENEIMKAKSLIQSPECIQCTIHGSVVNEVNFPFAVFFVLMIMGPYGLHLTPE